MLNTREIKFVICFCLILLVVIIVPKLPLTATINQSETIINTDNWSVIEGEGLSISLPSDYFGGNPARDLDDLNAKLANINPNLTNRLQKVRQNIESIYFLAFNTNIDDFNWIDNINIVAEKNNQKISLNNYFEKYKKQISTKIKLEQESEIKLYNNQAVKKIIGNYSLEETKVKQLFYIFEQNNNFWVVTYTTTADKFENNLSIFEKSIKTLKIL